MGNVVDRKGKESACLISFLSFCVTVTVLNYCAQPPKMSRYASILLSLVSMDPPNWFVTSLEYVNSCTCVAHIEHCSWSEDYCFVLCFVFWSRKSQPSSFFHYFSWGCDNNASDSLTVFVMWPAGVQNSDILSLHLWWFSDLLLLHWFGASYEGLLLVCRRWKGYLLLGNRSLGKLWHALLLKNVSKR